MQFRCFLSLFKLRSENWKKKNHQTAHWPMSRLNITKKHAVRSSFSVYLEKFRTMEHLVRWFCCNKYMMIVEAMENITIDASLSLDFVCVCRWVHHVFVYPFIHVYNLNGERWHTELITIYIDRKNNGFVIFICLFIFVANSYCFHEFMRKTLYQSKNTIGCVFGYSYIKWTVRCEYKGNERRRRRKQTATFDDVRRREFSNGFILCAINSLFCYFARLCSLLCCWYCFRFSTNF